MRTSIRWGAALVSVLPLAGCLDWLGAADLRPLRLADRAEAHRVALATLDGLERLRDWERQARGVGYVDEGYAAARLWKAEWERLGGEALVERAGAIRRELDPLGPGRPA